jgi:hypothetical protein
MQKVTAIAVPIVSVMMRTLTQRQSGELGKLISLFMVTIESGIHLGILLLTFASLS